MNKDVAQYSAGSKVLHGLVAVLVLAMLAFGYFMDDFAAPAQSTVYLIHKSVGLTILGLMLLRLFWVLTYGRPPLPKSVPLWERLLSRTVQICLYGLLLAMPLSGWIMSVASDRVPSYFGLFPVPFPGVHHNKALSDLAFQSHNTLAWILIALIALHLAGAAKHYWIDKDRVAQRMWWSN